MKGLIVYNGFRTLDSTTYKIKRFTEEFKKRGVEITSLTSLQLNLSIKDSLLTLKNLDEYSFCIYLDKDENLASLIETKIPLFNSSSSLIKCNDKLKTFMALLGTGIKMPKTIPSRLCYRESDFSDEKSIEFCKMVSHELSFPLICKECYGSLGLQVYLIKSLDEMISKEKELALIPHLYQEFISSSCGMDYRIFTIGGKVVAYMKRFNPSDFRSNVALGGKGYACELNDSYLKAACEASTTLGLDYAGVDILRGTDDTPILSEVNSNAFFTEIEKITSVNVTSLLVDHILKKILDK